MSIILNTTMLIALVIGSIVFDTGIHAQPAPLCDNNLHPSIYYGQDRIVATTKTQLAVLRHSATTWEYRDAPYPVRYWRHYEFGVYYANNDTVLAWMIYLPNAGDPRNILQLVRSVDEGRTWTPFYRSESIDYHIGFVSGYTVLLKSRVQDTCAAMTIDDTGTMRSCLQITTPFIHGYTAAPDHTYLLCMHHYDNVENYDYGSSMITVDRDGILSKTLLHGFIDPAWTAEGPVAYRRVEDRLILYYRSRQDTIAVPTWFSTPNGFALFDSTLWAQDDPGWNLESNTPIFTVQRWRIGAKQQDVKRYPSCWDLPSVRNDRLVWCDFDGLRYVTKDSDRIDVVPYPAGFIAPISVSWADGSLCYYLDRGQRTSDAPNTYRLLAVDPDDTLRRNLHILPYRLRTSCLGSRTGRNGTESCSLIDYDDTAQTIRVYDLAPGNGATLRYEYEDSAAIQYWYEVADTTWYYQNGELFMMTPDRERRSLCTLHTVICGPIVSTAYYRGDLFLLGRSGYYPYDSSFVLKCSFRTNTTVHLTRMFAWDSPSSTSERLVVMDSCLTISGLPDSVDIGTTIDGIRFDRPPLSDVITRQGPTTCLVRRLEERGRYEISTTSGRSLTPVDTISFHPYRTILGAYLMNGSIAIVTNEGTWLFPSVPMGVITDVAESNGPGPAAGGRRRHDAIAIRLPHEIPVESSSSHRQAKIYDIRGRLVSTPTIPPNAGTISIRNLDTGTYVVIIPDFDGSVVRTVMVE